MITQRGFSVLEFIIGIMLSAILMTTALTIYNQISKGALIVQRVTSTDAHIMILRDRLTTDLQGLCPLWFTSDQYEKKDTTRKQDASDAKQTSTDTTPLTATKQSDQKNSYLLAQSNNNQLSLLTFVTDNALSVYGDTSTRTVRVVYLLKPHMNRANTYNMIRKEDDTVSSTFDIEKLKEGTFATLAENITECSIEYGFIEKPSKKEKTKTEKSDKPLVYTWVQEWGAPKQEDKKSDEKNEPTVPDIIKLTIKIQHTDQGPIKEYQVYCPVIISQEIALQSFAQKRQATAKQPQTNTQQNPQPNNPKGV